jgi:hypothetical protein
MDKEIGEREAGMGEGMYGIVALEEKHVLLTSLCS